MKKFLKHKKPLSSYTFEPHRLHMDKILIKTILNNHMWWIDFTLFFPSQTNTDDDDVDYYFWKIFRNIRLNTSMVNICFFQADKLDQNYNYSIIVTTINIMFNHIDCNEMWQQKKMIKMMILCFEEHTVVTCARANRFMPVSIESFNTHIHTHTPFVFFFSQLSSTGLFYSKSFLAI